MVRAVWEDALGHFMCIFRRSIHPFFHRWDIGSIKESCISLFVWSVAGVVER